MVPNRSNVVEPMPETLKSIESRENERDSIECRMIERRSTAMAAIPKIHKMLIKVNCRLSTQKLDQDPHDPDISLAPELNTECGQILKQLGLKSLGLHQSVL